MPRHLLARLDWRALACGLPLEPQTEQLAPTQAALSLKQQDRYRVREGGAYVQHSYSSRRDWHCSRSVAHRSTLAARIFKSIRQSRAYNDCVWPWRLVLSDSRPVHLESRRRVDHGGTRPFAYRLSIAIRVCRRDRSVLQRVHFGTLRSGCCDLGPRAYEGAAPRDACRSSLRSSVQ